MNRPPTHAVEGAGDAGRQRAKGIVAADKAVAERDWPLAGALFAGAFRDATDMSERRRYARAAAMAYRRARDLTAARAVLGELLQECPPDPLIRHELARLEAAVHRAKSESEYWHDRQRLVYLQVAKEITRRIASNARSIVDVGSNGTPILDWFPEADRRVSIDLERPYRAPGVVSLTDDFLGWNPEEHFDVGLSFQVMEHVPAADAFAQRLLEICSVVVISVPYRWEKGKAKSHVHDPVDEEKLRTWFGREPNYTYLARELNGHERLIAVYDRESQVAWRSIDEEKFRYRWTLRGVEALLGVQPADTSRGDTDDVMVADLVERLVEAEDRYQRLRDRRLVRAALSLSEIARRIRR